MNATPENSLKVEGTVEQVKKDDDDVKKPVDLKKVRAERFGLPPSEEEKKQIRAERCLFFSGCSFFT